MNENVANVSNTNKYFGLLYHTLQGAKHPGTAHQSEETNIPIAEDEINENSHVNLPSTNTQSWLTDQRQVHKPLPVYLSP